MLSPLFIPWPLALSGAGDGTASPSIVAGDDVAPAFLTPFYSDAGVLYTPTSSGGSFVAALPVANVHDERLERIARTTDATLTSTKFETDLQTSRALGGFATLIPNASLTARVRYRLSTTAGVFTSPVYDSGFTRIFPTGLTAEDVAGSNALHTHVAATNQTGRYVLTEIDDTTNADGYLDVARFVAAGAWRIGGELGLSVGAKIGLEDETTRTKTGGGAAIYNAQRSARTYAVTVANITEAEAFANAWRMQRRLGLSGQLVFVFDANDATYGWERNILCTLRELGGLEWAQYDALNAVWGITEVL